MTTNSKTSGTTRGSSLHHSSLTDRATNVQSAAVRGATQAFSARGDSQEPKALHESTNSARAAGGYVARQKSTSPPKRPASAFTAHSRPQAAHASQVQQLVKDFEQSSATGQLQWLGNAVVESGRVLSRSPSQVAARIASIKGPSPFRQALPLRNGLKDNSSSRDTEVSSLYCEVTESLPGFQSVSSKSVNRQSHATPLPAPLKRASTTQTMPAAMALEQKPSAGEKSNNAGLHNNLPRDESSRLAAQAAVRKLVLLRESSVPLSPRRECEDPFDFNGGLLEEIGRGRSPTGRRGPLEGEVHISTNDSGQRHSDELPKEPNALLSSINKSEIVSSASKLRGHLPTPSKQTGPLAQYTDEKTGLTELSLADAIVASSLASSRAPSPAKAAVPAPPPPRKSSVSRPLFWHHQTSDTDDSRHASPHKGMRQTLRQYPSEDSDEEDERRKHKHFMKHPNKHREGSRKRWKDKVTERERKRYEGVWAANKGMFTTTPLSLPNMHVTLETPASELVLDLVVRDIWNRSRLPTDTLAEIWDLVARQGARALTRDEFVLGLWLIDQKLKGRKLPIRVSPTLWASVRYA